MNMEQRLYCRMPFTGDVLVNGSTLFRAANISEDGIYIVTGRPFALGNKVTVEFYLGGRKYISEAAVKSCDGSVGVGLNFTYMKEADRDSLRGYIEEHYDKAGQYQKVVLIVDDNNATRMVYKTRLLLDGYMVVEARDGMEAVEKMRTVRPDIVVLDLYMENMDGYKVLAYIRGNESLKDMPVIIFSARDTQIEMDRARRAGASNFLVKIRTSPVKLSEDIKRLLKMASKTTKIA